MFCISPGAFVRRNTVYWKKNVQKGDDDFIMTPIPVITRLTLSGVCMGKEGILSKVVQNSPKNY